MTPALRPVEKTRLVVGVTGHRNLRETELPRLRKEVRAFFEGLQRDFPELPLTLLAPLAALVRLSRLFPRLQDTDHAVQQRPLAC